jgi:hypothetical protein
MVPEDRNSSSGTAPTFYAQFGKSGSRTLSPPSNLRSFWVLSLGTVQDDYTLSCLVYNIIIRCAQARHRSVLDKIVSRVYKLCIIRVFTLHLILLIYLALALESSTVTAEAPSQRRLYSVDVPFQRRTHPVDVIFQRRSLSRDYSSDWYFCISPIPI